MEKKMSPKAFWLLVGGVGLSVLISALMLLINFLMKDTLREEAIKAAIEEFERQSITYDQAMLDKVVDFSITFTFGMLIASFAIGLLLNSYFLFRMVKNRKNDSKQGYLTVLFVFHIIGLVFNAYSVFGGDYIAIIGIVANIAVIVGRVMQKNYVPPRVNYEDNNNNGNNYFSASQNPYGSYNPPSQNPFEDGNNNSPSNQNPTDGN